MNEKKSYRHLVSASALAGFFKIVLTYPIDSLKNKIYIQTSKSSIESQRQIIIRVFTQTYQKEGIRGFYQGIGISSIGGAIAFSLYMSSFEFASKQLNSHIFFYKPLNNFIAGFIAEAIACIIYLPIDVIKERMQVQSNTQLYNYKNSIDAFIKIIQQEGAKTLYKAYPATQIYFGIWSGVNFSFYQKFKEINCQMPGKPSFFESCVNSSLSSMIALILTSPISIAKVRIQIQKQRANNQQGLGDFRYKNVLDGMIKIIKNEGFRNLYLGFPVKIFSVIPTTVLGFSLTEYFRQIFNKNQQ